MTRTDARGPIPWLGALIVIYLGLPLVAFIVRFVTAPERGFGSAGLFPALWVSVFGATISLAIITLLGVPLAYYLAHSDSRVSRVVGLVVQIPLALPPVMAGIILVYVVGPYTWLGRLSGQRLTESMAGIVIAMTFCAAPFLIVTARAAFASIDRGLLDVAATLGHSDISRLLRVSVPLASGGIRAGMTLSWLRAFGEYGAVVILAYNPASLPIYTYNQFSGTGLPTTLAPTALALGVAIVAVTLGRLRWKRHPGAMAKLPASSAPGTQPAHPVGFDIHHRLGSFSLDVAHEPLSAHLAILGASGSGKSALLRCVAGLYGPAPGTVFYGDDVVSGVPIEKRHVGYVAQGFSLFPHLTVWRQLLFGKGATPELASYWLEHLGLEGLEGRLPSELSGGQRQRVALAQVLCRSPKVLLLDEPFSALDMPVRRELRRELRQLQHETGIASVVVTHDPDEAAFLSDSVIIIAEGRVLQSGSNRQVYTQPTSAQVAGLLGIANVFEASVVDALRINAEGTLVKVNVEEYELNTRVQWSIRPERITLRPEVTSEPATDVVSTSLRGTVTDVVNLGAIAEIVVRVSENLSIEVRSSDWFHLDVGDQCAIMIPADDIAIWPVSSNVAAALVG